MAETTIDRARSNGAKTLREAPAIQPQSRRGRLPELAIGLALMIGFALAAVLWHSSSSQKDPVLALSVDVARGDTIDAADLRVVYVASDDPITAVPQAASGEIVGRIAVTDLDAGTLVSRRLVADRVALQQGDGVVGLALDPGQYPANGLLPGDKVNVVTALVATDTADDSDVVIATGAEVFAVDPLGGQGRQFVSLRMPEDVANRVAASAERGPVRLVLVGS